MEQGGFSHSKRSSVTVESATFDTDVLAIQNGTEVYQGSTEVTKYEAINVTDAGNITTKFTAIGTAGSEIGYVYKIDNSGTIIAQFTQTAVPAAAGEFAYASDTKTLTFFETDPDKPVVGDTLAMVYTFMSADNAKRITISADGIPPTVMATFDGFAKDTCTGQLFPCQIEGMAQVDGNWSWEMSADGEPAVHGLNMEFVKTCTSSEMYRIIIYTEDEAGE